MRLTMGIGTPRYMAPEVITTTEGARLAYGPSADVYSFGMLLWEVMRPSPPLS